MLSRLPSQANQPQRKRMRTKTTPQTTAPPPPPPAPPPPVQHALVGVDLGEEADAKRGRRVYLVTLPHPKQATTATGRPLVAPGDKTRKEILQILLESCASPIYTDARSIARQESVPLKCAGEFRELHQEDANGNAFPHDHLAVLAERDFMYMPVKRALLERHGLASHWSCTHNGYWSVIRYLHHPTPKKPWATLDKKFELWAKPPMQHPELQDCMNEPTTASAIEARRLRTDRKAAEEQKPSARITEIDVWPIVVRNNFRNTPDDMNAHMALMDWAVDYGSTPMRDFLFKHRARLGSLIDDIWKWENVKDDLAVARLRRLDALHKAAGKPCRCQGLWAHHVLESFRLNGIDAAELCGDVLTALVSGRSESLPVIVLAGARGGEGKSMFLKALYGVFGEEHVFITPEAGNFPLVDLPGRKVIFLDEWRFDDTVLSYPTQCQLFDGSAVSINRAQNVQGVSGHTQYRGTAPIFVTTKLGDLDALAALAADNPVTGTPGSIEASMLHRRLKVYRYTVRIPKPPPNMPFCEHCFAQMVLHGGSCPACPVWTAPSGPSAVATSGGTWV
jgi:hypothetical protein